jgi:hypothetical protein
MVNFLGESGDDISNSSPYGVVFANTASAAGAGATERVRVSSPAERIVQHGESELG